MSCAGGPDLATNKLILHVDAANSRSYSGSGNTINDLSGLNQSGTLTNGPTFSNGLLTFNKASSQYIEFGDSDNFSFINNIFTMSFWVKFNSTGIQGVIGKRGSPWEYSIFANPSGTLNFVCWGINGDGVYATSTSFSSGIWYNFAWASDGTNAYLYTNGNWINTVVKSGFSMGNTAQPLRFGAGGNAATGLVYLDGVMSNFSLYNRCLTENDIKQNYNAFRSRFNI